ncbi:MAG: hypothetical protein K2W99_07565 [Chthoniobacterales bacterium]|nr:hypothetical protein [Chthoniobacterales bacterium]
MKTPRIASLQEVAQRTNKSHQFGYCLCDFLDGFYPKPTETAIHQKPENISPYYNFLLGCCN